MAYALKLVEKHFKVHRLADKKSVNGQRKTGLIYDTRKSVTAPA